MSVKRRIMAVTNTLSTWISTSNLSRRLTRASTSSLRGNWLPILYLLTLSVLVAGTVNTILEGMRPEFAGAIILPNRAVQTVSEAVINTLVVLLGIAGMYLLYQGGRRTARRRVANLYLMLGLIVVLLALSMGLYVVDVKS